MAINQETAAIKARMDRIPAALSPDLVERIAADRASGVVNPYRCNDDQVIRRIGSRCRQRHAHASGIYARYRKDTSSSVVHPLCR